MNQSSVIAAALLAGFVLYVAAQDRLKVYAAVLWGNTKAPLPSSEPVAPLYPAASPAGGIGSSAGGGAVDLLSKFPDFFGGGGSAIESAGTLLLEGF